MIIKVGDRNAYNAKVYLNGKQQTQCIMADDEKGIIQRYITDKSGKVLSVGLEARTETVSGQVRIEIEQ